MWDYLKDWLRGLSDLLSIVPSSLIILFLELEFSCFHDDPVHVAGFCGKDFGALNLVVTFVVEFVLSHCRRAGLLESDVQQVFLYSSLMYSKCSYTAVWCTASVLILQSDVQQVFLYCSLMYSKCSYTAVWCTASVLILQSDVQQVFLYCSLMYSKCSYTPVSINGQSAHGWQLQCSHINKLYYK